MAEIGEVVEHLSRGRRLGPSRKKGQLIQGSPELSGKGARPRQGVAVMGRLKAARPPPWQMFPTGQAIPSTPKASSGGEAFTDSISLVELREGGRLWFFRDIRENHSRVPKTLKQSCSQQLLVGERKQPRP